MISALVRRGSAAGAMMIALGLAQPASAQAVRDANDAYIVIDADTNQVLYEDAATEARYPASITKVMTIYMLLEAVETGQVAWDQPIRVSANAARQPRSDLGVRAGSTISVEDAINALVVRSANDVAVAVAEHLAGSERAFAERMTRRARDLGMADTTFRNASGLPDRQQLTTAEDLARLAIAIRRDFPTYFHMFSRTSFSWNGETITGHNRPLSSVPGVDGLKTGFTSWSGFNLATTATRGGRRIVTVVLGGRTGAERDAEVATLVEAAFADLGVAPDGQAASVSAGLASSADQADAIGLVADAPASSGVGGVQMMAGYARSTRAMAMTGAPEALRWRAPPAAIAAAATVMAEAAAPPPPVLMAATAPATAPERPLRGQISHQGEDGAPAEAEAPQAPARAAEVRLAALEPVVPSAPAVVQMAALETPAPEAAAAVAEPVALIDPGEAAAASAGVIEFVQLDPAEPGAAPAAPRAMAQVAEEPSGIVPPVRMAGLSADDLAAVERLRTEARVREQARLDQAMMAEAQARAERAQRVADEREARRAEEASERLMAEQRAAADAETRRRAEREAAVRAERQRQRELADARGSAVVQVGAFRAETQAEDALQRLASYFPNVARGEVTRVETTSGRWFRVRFSGIASSVASDVCQSLTRRGGPCQIVSN